MADMLVKLYELPQASGLAARLRRTGIEIRRALAPEKRLVSDWVRESFGLAWAGECEVSFSRSPVSCFIACRRGRILGFACHDATCRNFFGPAGVAPEARGQGIGKALLLECLRAMASQGYAYAIIGGAGSPGFYRKAVGAVPIRGSSPGIYRGLLRSPRGA